MSYTEMKVIASNGDFVGYEEFKNSHGCGPVIWEILGRKYSLVPPDNETCRYCMLGHGMGHAMQAAEKVWKLFSEHKDELPEWEWITLCCTFDNAYIPAEHLLYVAEQLERFHESFRYLMREYRPEVLHAPLYAAALRKMAAEVEKEGWRGAAFYQTSIIDDPWTVRTVVEGDEVDFRPYNLDNPEDTKHWAIEPPTREE